MKKKLLLYLALIPAFAFGQVINLDPSSMGQLDALFTANGIRYYVSVLNTTGVETGTPVYPYNTIQEALDVCEGGEVILVYPGTYTETITFGDNNVAIIGVGRPEEIIITQADANVVNFATTTGGSISNVTISLTAPTDAAKDAISITGPGSAEIRFCDLSLATAATISSIDQPYIANLLYHTAGIAELKILHGNVTYAHTGTTTTGVKVPFYCGAGNLLELDGIHMINIDNSGTATATAIFAHASAGSIFMHHCHADIDDNDATFTVGFGYLVASGTTVEYAYNTIHVHGDANNVYGVYITNSTIRLEYNHIHSEVSGAGNAYGLTEAGAGAITSQFDDIITTGGSSGNIVYVNSPSDGALNISDVLLVGDGTAALPSISFINDPNSGIYSVGDNSIGLSLNGVLEFGFIGAGFHLNRVEGAYIYDVDATATAPTLLPRQSDINTGAGSAGADLLSHIAGGKEGIRIDGLLGGIEIYLIDTTIFDEGAYLSNEETDTFKINETVIKIEGDLVITGDLTKNAAGGLTYISTSGTQTIGTGGTFEKLYEGAMVYTGAHLYGFTESNGRLTYTGTKTKHFTIMSHTTIESDEAAALVQVRLAKDGTTIAGTNTQHDYTAVDTDADLSFSWLMELSTNEYLEIYGTSDTNGDTFVVHNLTLTVVEHSVWLVVLLLLPNIIINLFRKREDEFKIAA